MALVCERISMRYEGAEGWALQGASLEVRPGKLLGIVGRSGSGKTTLLNCLAGRLQSTEGSVRVEGEGQPLVPGTTAVQQRAYAQQVCLVGQLPERQLFGETVYEDVAFGPRNLGLAEEEVDQRVASALEDVRFDAARAREVSPFALSGGEQRRVALAGMLALQSPYLLLDEPTAGLDAAGCESVLRILAELAAQGTGIAVVSHDLDLLAECADTLAVLNNGELVAQGATAEVLQQEALLQSAGLEVPLAARMAARLRARGAAIPAIATARDLLKAVGQ